MDGWIFFVLPEKNLMCGRTKFAVSQSKTDGRPEFGKLISEENLINRGQFNRQPE